MLHSVSALAVMSFYAFVALSNKHINGGVASPMFALMSCVNNHSSSA